MGNHRNIFKFPILFRLDSFVVFFAFRDMKTTQKKNFSSWLWRWLSYTLFFSVAHISVFAHPLDNKSADDEFSRNKRKLFSHFPCHRWKFFVFFRVVWLKKVFCFFHSHDGHLKIKSPRCRRAICYTFTYITFFIRSIIKSTRRWTENNEERRRRRKGNWFHVQQSLHSIICESLREIIQYNTMRINFQ